jgi:hypothetical protein
MTSTKASGPIELRQRYHFILDEAGLKGLYMVMIRS